MALNVPMGVLVTWLVLLCASNLDLLETPLWQIDVASAEIASQIRVLQSDGAGQSADLAPITVGGIVDNFDDPVVLAVTDSDVAI